MKPSDGGPAFPRTADCINHHNKDFDLDGMSLRDYAAIKLRVPSSEHKWLNEMIRESLRSDFAVKAMQSLSPEYENLNDIATDAYRLADAMLKAREEK